MSAMGAAALAAGMLFAENTAQAIAVKADAPLPESLRLSRWKAFNANIVHGENGSVEIQTQPSTSGVSVRRWQGWDWTSANLSFALENKSAIIIPFVVRFRDKEDREVAAFADLDKGEKGSFEVLLTLFKQPFDGGGRGMPSSLPKSVGLKVRGDANIDLANIVEISISLSYDPAPLKVVLSDLRAAPATDTNAIIDAYGQYARDEWPGKIHDNADFKSQLEQELKDIAAHPKPASLDRFGGWAEGPALPPGKFFRAEKVNGKWWLVTPEGHLFFSNGVNAVRAWENTEISDETKHMFTWVPWRGAFSQYYTKWNKMLDVYAVNLNRKYGPEYKDEWRKLTLQRLNSWGLNTIGAWSDEGFIGNGEIPYIVIVDTSRAIDGLAPDAFSADFAASARQKWIPIIERTKNDPYCMGYFVDNEIPWDGASGKDAKFVVSALAQDGGQSAVKAAVVEFLKKKYDDNIKLLSRAWGLREPLDSWESLKKPFTPPAEETKKFSEDKYEISDLIANQYYRVVRETLKALAPGQLYFGSRFTYLPNDGVVRAATRHCDVVSYNWYGWKVEQLSHLPAELDRPTLIGEFSWGAQDRGSFYPGIKRAASQARRAENYRDYLLSALDHPTFVGVHWFKYVDQPTTGLWTQETGNFGFVSITDTPFPEMVEASREVMRTLYPHRYRSKNKTSESSQ